MAEITVRGDFWGRRLEINACQAIFHQWEQLNKSGCIENFRVAAGLNEGVHFGWFFADSDAYKWLEAAVRISKQYPDERLMESIEQMIELISQAQLRDGYIYTYNQILFPDTRWQNLQIEHELYCHGHLIEAGVTHYDVTGKTNLLDIALKAAGCIVTDFSGKEPEWTPGHEEIEIALLRLYQIEPDHPEFLEMARQFIEQRGRIKNLPPYLFRQNDRVEKRKKIAEKRRQEYLFLHPEKKEFHLPPENPYKKQFASGLRRFAGYWNGQYFQQHAPVRQQLSPVGHSVRFAYFVTGAAMLANECNDASLIAALEQTWERMVTRRMYVTGGVGSVPVTEGFGRDYELDPQFAYAETCAALACLFWNWEMLRYTGEAKYSDLFEWQLYNAALVGIGSDGTKYFYNNPLTCRGEVTRQPWFAVPCCPSNISRTWANLGKYICSQKEGRLCLHQYISSELKNQSVLLPDGNSCTVSFSMKSGLPWDGKVTLTVEDISPLERTAKFELYLRQPSWADEMTVRINGIHTEAKSVSAPVNDQTASGLILHKSIFRSVDKDWKIGDRLEIRFEMPVRLYHAHPKMKGHKNKVTVTCGPLVYCLENIDNKEVDIFSARIDTTSLHTVSDDAMGEKMVQIRGKTTAGTQVIFIPYYFWGNRGSSQMTVWINT